MGDSEEIILRKYTLEELDSAAHLLVAAADQDPNKTESHLCHLSTQQANSLLRPLHAWIDHQIDHYLQRAQTGKSYAKPTWIKNCQQSCHCGLYVSILEKTDDQKLSPKDRKTLSHLQRQAAKLSPLELKRCIQKTRWFCKSDLLKQLKKVQSTPEFQE